MNSHQVRFDADLIRRYDRSGPRYTSYPTAVQFTDRFGLAEYRAAALASNQDPIPRPLSLYVHIPFCSSPCFYCGCTKVITRNHEKAEAYLYRLHREIELQSQLYDRDREVEQLHFGGGTPTFLTSLEIDRLIEKLGSHFKLSSDPGREYSIELDPRTITRDTLRDLARVGFNRCSLGIQDFDPLVQEAVNRIQSVPDTLRLIREAREFGFGSVSVDLIYGLPKQNLEGFAKTIDTVLSAKPDRFAVYAYAHLPQMFKAQRQLNAEFLPTPETRLDLLGLTIEKLTERGLCLHRHGPLRTAAGRTRGGAGERHAAPEFPGVFDPRLLRPDRARGELDRQGRRQFRAEPEDAARVLRRAGPRRAAGAPRPHADARRHHPPRRHPADHVLRRARLRRDGKRFGIDFRSYFASELVALEPMVADGLAEFAEPGLRVLPAGRLLLRHLGMAFDAYLPSAQASQQRFSKAI